MRHWFAAILAALAVLLGGADVGVSADVAAGAGLAANVRLGGGKSVALQPLSVTGSRGINIAAGLNQVQPTRRGSRR